MVGVCACDDSRRKPLQKQHIAPRSTDPMVLKGWELFTTTVLDSQEQHGYGAWPVDHTRLEWYDQHHNPTFSSNQRSLKRHCSTQRLVKLTQCNTVNFCFLSLPKTPCQCRGQCKRSPRAPLSPQVNLAACPTSGALP